MFGTENLIYSGLKQKRLFEEFPPVTTKEWMDKINADLKGADFNQRLVWKTGEGFDVMPFYRREDIENLNHVDSGIFKSDGSLAHQTEHKSLRLCRSQ